MYWGSRTYLHCIITDGDETALKVRPLPLFDVARLQRRGEHRSLSGRLLDVIVPLVPGAVLQVLDLLETHFVLGGSYDLSRPFGFQSARSFIVPNHVGGSARVGA